MCEVLGPVPCASPELMAAEVIQPHIYWGLHLHVLQLNKLTAIEPMASGPKDQLSFIKQDTEKICKKCGMMQQLYIPGLKKLFSP